jgi:type II secretory pathway pseudopilin PulG
MTLAHGLLSSVVLSGVVFAASTLPLGLFGAEPVTLKIGERPTFSGRLEELATPYLALTTILSLGIGVAATSLLGWQASSQKLSQTEEQLASLKQQLQEKEALVEHFKFSDQKLQATGLDFFLESETAHPQPSPATHGPLSNGDDRRLSYFSGINGQPQAKTRGGNISRLSEPSSADFSSHNLKDEPQVEALLDNLKQVVNQIEKLKTS